MAFRPFFISEEDNCRLRSSSIGTVNPFRTVVADLRSSFLASTAASPASNNSVRMAQSSLLMSPITSSETDDLLTPPQKRLRRRSTEENAIIDCIESAKAEILFAINKNEQFHHKHASSSSSMIMNESSAMQPISASSSPSSCSGHNNNNGNNNVLVPVGGSLNHMMSAKKLSELEKISGCPITFTRKVLEHFAPTRPPPAPTSDVTSSSNSRNNNGANNKAHRWLTSDERLLTAVAAETMTRFQPQCMVLFQSALKTAVEKRLYAESMYRKNKTTATTPNNSINNTTAVNLTIKTEHNQLLAPTKRDAETLDVCSL